MISLIIIISFIVVVLGISYFSNLDINYFVSDINGLYKNCNFYITSIDKSAKLREKNITNLYNIIKKKFGKDIIKFGVDGDYISDDEIFELKK